MYKTLIERVSQYKHLKAGALSVGLYAKLPVAKDIISTGLAEIMRKFPSFSEINEVENGIFLKNREIEIEKQELLKISNQKIFEYVWGASVDMDIEQRSINIFDAIQDRFKLDPTNVDVIDFKFHLIFDWAGHHQKAIWDAFYKCTPLSRIFNPGDILQDNILIRGIVDESRKGVVSLGTNVTDEEVINKKFQNDLLKLVMAIGQTGNIPTEGKISKTISGHLEVALKFIEGKFMPNVADIFDKACETTIGK